VLLSGAIIGATAAGGTAAVLLELTACALSRSGTGTGSSAAGSATAGASTAAGITGITSSLAVGTRTTAGKTRDNLRSCLARAGAWVVNVHVETGTEQGFENGGLGAIDYRVVGS
jgi:hypothetical protein